MRSRSATICNRYQKIGSSSQKMRPHVERCHATSLRFNRPFILVSFSPARTTGNSPPFQRWEPMKKTASPAWAEETAEAQHVLSSLTGLVLFSRCYPAMNRRDIFLRPAGLCESSVPRFPILSRQIICMARCVDAGSPGRLRRRQRSPRPVHGNRMVQSSAHSRYRRLRPCHTDRFSPPRRAHAGRLP